MDPGLGLRPNRDDKGGQSGASNEPTCVNSELTSVNSELKQNHSNPAPTQENGTVSPVSLVVAVAENGVIGVRGGLPWRVKADLKRFRSVTMGKPILMGR